MYKRQVWFFFQTRKQAVFLQESEGGPSDVRDLEARPVRNSVNGAFQNTEARHAGGFLAAFKQELQPQANAEERLVLLDEMPDRLFQLQGTQGSCLLYTSWQRYL